MEIHKNRFMAIYVRIMVIYVKVEAGVYPDPDARLIASISQRKNPRYLANIFKWGCNLTDKNRLLPI